MPHRTPKICPRNPAQNTNESSNQVQENANSALNNKFGKRTWEGKKSQTKCVERRDSGEEEWFGKFNIFRA
jgi:hypothetical protein